MCTWSRHASPWAAAAMASTIQRTRSAHSSLSKQRPYYGQTQQEQKQQLSSWTSVWTARRLANPATGRRRPSRRPGRQLGLERESLSAHRRQRNCRRRLPAPGALLPFTALEYDAIDGSSGFGHVSGPRAERLAHDHRWKSQNLYSTVPTYVYCKN